MSLGQAPRRLVFRYIYKFRAPFIIYPRKMWVLWNMGSKKESKRKNQTDSEIHSRLPKWCQVVLQLDTKTRKKGVSQERKN